MQRVISLLGSGVNGSQQESFGSAVHIQIMETETKLLDMLSKFYKDLSGFIEGYLNE